MDKQLRKISGETLRNVIIQLNKLFDANNLTPDQANGVLAMMEAMIIYNLQTLCPSCKEHEKDMIDLFVKAVQQNLTLLQIENDSIAISGEA